MEKRPGEDPERECESAERMSRRAAPGVWRELFALLRENRKWWLIPAVLVLMAAGALLLLAGSGAAPLIYTLF
jgi:hypothetical protein